MDGEMNRRQMISRTSKAALVVGALGIVSESEVFGNPLILNPAMVAFVRDLTIAALEKLAKASDYLAKALDNLGTSVNQTQFKQNEHSDYHRKYGLSIIPKNDIPEISTVELTNPETYMKWQADEYLRPIQDDNSKPRPNDLNERELHYVKELHPKEGYEPWIPITARMQMDWGQPQRQFDFGMMYGGLLEHEIDSGETKKFILNDSQPDYYRWIYAGPGKKPVLAVGYTHVKSQNQYLWTYNRPDLTPKQRQPAMDAYLQKVAELKVPKLLIPKASKAQEGA
jgi:hypothetical protein